MTKKYKIIALIENGNSFEKDTLGVDLDTTIETALRTFQTTGAIQVKVINIQSNEVEFVR